MQKLITIIAIFLSLESYPQCDSIKLKITRIRTLPDKKVEIKMKGEKENYITVCDCGKFKYKKGDTVTLCRNQLLKPKKILK